jgi:type I restriction enzyme S subunit
MDVTSSPSCPKGYKQTEVGVIPNEWVELTVSDLIAFEGGSQPDKSDFLSAPRHGYIRLIQIRDYKTDKYDTYIPIRLARRFCDEHDIMIGRYGPPIFQILRGIAGAYNVALIKAIPNSRLSRTYAYYFLKQEKLFRFVEKLSQRSSGQTGIDLDELRRYPFSLPPTQAEQEAIAEVLSDADALIESLEQLITKKRQIKQGAMQELLTGKTRLPGFETKPGTKQTEVGKIPEDWEVVRLGEVSQITTGRKDVNEGNPTGEYPFFTCSRTHTYSDFYSFDMEAVLIAGNGDVGNLSYYYGKFEAYQRTYVVHSISTHVGYLWQQLQDRLATSLGLGKIGSSIPYIKKENLTGFSFGSTTKSEQEAIAEALSDMDSEIDAIQSKLTKARQLKQGMMHNLLTGRIRLV